MDKTVIIEKIHLFYQDFGKDKQNLLLLHGWGQSHAFWKDIVERLSKDYHIYVLDLPGFGISQQPSETWTVADYADFVHAFVTELHITNPTIIGHSFGGRIASVYTSHYPVKKLILYSNGGLPNKSLKTTLYKQLIVKLGRVLFPNLLYRSHTTIFKPKNYRNNIIVTTKRSKRMLDIYMQPFYDLTKHLKRIQTPTLVIVGGKDFIIPPQITKKIHKLIPNAQLVEIPNATHFAHREAPDIFYDVVEKFLNEAYNRASSKNL